MTVFLALAAGRVLMFALVRWFGFDFLRAAATTKVLISPVIFAALVLFMADRKRALCGRVTHGGI
jgi:hypothetical protein